MFSSAKVQHVFKCMHGFRKFCQRGSNSEFLFSEGIPLYVGHHRPASETPLKSFAGGPMTADH